MFLLSHNVYLNKVIIVRLSHLWISCEQRMKWINFVNRITMCNLKASSQVPSQPPPPPPPLPLPLNRPVSKYHNTLCCPSKIVHKHCFQFLLGLTIASREIENNSYAKFDGQKQALWY